MLRSARTPCSLAAVITCCLAVLAGAARAADGLGPSGHPLPRFVSVISDQVNVRTGPGTRYPVVWVFTRKNLPVMVTQEFEHWRKIRDRDGAEGWVHKGLLSGRRYGIVEGEAQTLRRAPNAEAPATFRAERGVIGRLIACEPDWCRMEVADLSGWLPKTQLFGALPAETFK